MLIPRLILQVLKVTDAFQGFRIDVDGILSVIRIDQTRLQCSHCPLAILVKQAFGLVLNVRKQIGNIVTVDKLD